MELTVDQVIEIDDQKVAAISTKLLDKIKDIIGNNADTMFAGATDKDKCANAFNAWLDDQFGKGRVPTGQIFVSEYGKGVKDLSLCRSINFADIYQQALGAGGMAIEQEATLFELEGYRKIIKSNKCTDNFFEPSNAKIQLTDIEIEILKNTLNMSTPITKIYTSDKSVDKVQLKQDDAETTLAQAGKIWRLAETLPFPKRFIGVSPAKLESNPQIFSKAQAYLVSLDGNVIIIPGLIGAQLETAKIADRKYFIIPQGGLQMMLKIKLSITGSLLDAKCMLDEFKAAIRKDEQERGY